MGKSSPSPPPAPDYRGAATETAAGNLDAARLASRANRVNQYTPYGNQTYTDLGGDRWRQDTSLTPMGQQLLDQQNRTSAGLAGLQDSATGRVGDMAGSAIPQAYSPNGQQPGVYSPNGQTPGVYDPNQSTNNATQLIMNRQQPMLDHDQEALRTQLANQGLDPSSEAYKRSMDQFGRQKNDAYSQASLQGISLGQGQQAQTYGQQIGNQQLGQGQQAQTHAQELSNQQLAQGQQAQSYAQQTANRNIPLNELNAIRTGSQVTNPTFSGVPGQGQTAGPDFMGAAGAQNQYNLGLYNSQVGQANSANGLFGQLGAAGLSAIKWSDRRLKRNIKPLGKTSGGINAYAYDYVWGEPGVGVMADEVAHIPGAVHTHASGYKMVDYSKVL